MGKGATSETGSIFLELTMCGGGVRSILLLPLVAICLETIYVCIWGKFIFISVVLVVTVCGGGVCGNVAAVVEDSVFSLGVLKYVVCLCKGVALSSSPSQDGHPRFIMTFTQTSEAYT